MGITFDVTNIYLDMSSNPSILWATLGDCFFPELLTMLRQHHLIFDLTFRGVKKSPCLRLMEWKGEREREIIGKTKRDQMRQFSRDGE